MKGKNSIRKLAVLLLIFVVASVSYYIGSRQSSSNQPTKQIENYDKIKEILDEKWFNYTGTVQSEVDPEISIIKGMVNALNDPYTEYLTAKENEDFSDSINDDFYGIGISINDKGVISTVQADSQAENAGLKAGNRILRIDQQEYMNRHELKDLLRNPDTKVVALEVEQDGLVNKLVINKEMQEGTTIYNLVEYEGEVYGYLSIRTFGQTTPESVGDALVFFKKNGVEKLVIDLRNDLGGYVDSAISVLDYFFAPDEVVCQLVERDANITEYKTEKETQYVFEQGYVVVNKNTASAAEIVAGCLQEKLGYQLVGENTYGKGIAQDYYVFEDNSVLKYTFALWSLPSGRSIQDNGLIVNQVKDLPELRYEIIA